jgi:Ni,Fe-hydrogenase III small subunit
MSMKGFRYLVCPDCGRHGVKLYMRARGEDGYSCRYCDFEFFSALPARYDRERLERLKRVNPSTTDW